MQQITASSCDVAHRGKFKDTTCISDFLLDALEADIITKKQYEDLKGLLEKRMEQTKHKKSLHLDEEEQQEGNVEAPLLLSDLPNRSLTAYHDGVASMENTLHLSEGNVQALQDVTNNLTTYDDGMV